MCVCACVCVFVISEAPTHTVSRTTLLIHTTTNTTSWLLWAKWMHRSIVSLRMVLGINDTNRNAAINNHQI